MSAEPVESSGSTDFRDASPGEIRAALIPEERLEFDVAWGQAMREATDARDLTVVYETLESWRHIAWMTAARGHEAHRQMWRRAAARYTDEAIPVYEPFAVTKARLGY